MSILAIQNQCAGHGVANLSPPVIPGGRLSPAPRLARSAFVALLASLAIMGAPRLAGAQFTARCELAGVVRDQTGGVIVGAAVVLQRSTGEILEQQSDAQGRYRFANLPPALYVLTIVMDGFAAESSEIDLADTPRLTRDVTLRVETRENVEVTPDLEPVVAQMLSDAELRDLPTEPAQLLERLREMAATAGANDADVFVDGFRGGRLPPPSAIQSIRIVSNPFAPEFGELGRARIEISTKAAAAKYSGDLSNTFNNHALTARNAFAPREVPFHSNAFNGYLSGPLIANRLGFVLYAGDWQYDRSEVINATVLNRDLTPAVLTEDVVSTSGTRNGSGTLSYQLAPKHLLVGSFSRTESESTNQGLGGLDLAERAYRSGQRESRGQLSLNSTFGRAAVHEFRASWSRTRNVSAAVTDAPAVFVLESFNAGGNQDALASHTTATTLEVNERLTLSRKRSIVKVGFDLETMDRADLDRSNFGGSFTFGAGVLRDSAGRPVLGPDGVAVTVSPLESYRQTLLGAPGYGPSQFTISTGDQAIAFRQWWGAWFIQEDRPIGSKLLLTYGLRHDVQSLGSNSRSFSPRFGLAWTVDQARRNTVRLGAGLFHDRIGTELEFDVRRYDGHHQRPLVVDRPAFFPVIPATLDGGTERDVTMYRRADDLHTPASAMSSISLDRQVNRQTRFSLSYTVERMWNLLRLRNINAPLNGDRPMPDRGAVLQYESTARSFRQEVVMSGRTTLAPVRVSGSYTLSWRRSDSDGSRTIPADSNDLTTEYGPSSEDRRHRGNVSFSVPLPLKFEARPSLTALSGRPFNIRTGRDNNGDTLFTDRPSFAVAGEPGAIATPFGIFNPNPRPGESIIPRNYGRESTQWEADLSVLKTIGLRGPNGAKATLSARVSNLFNSVNLTRYRGVITSSTFGTAGRALDGRRLYLTAQVSF